MPIPTFPFGAMNKRVVGVYVLPTVSPVSKKKRTPPGPPPYRYAELFFATQADPFHAAPPAMNKLPAFAEVKYPPESVPVDVMCIWDAEEPEV
jgi:hypothetical protein